MTPSQGTLESKAEMLARLGINEKTAVEIARDYKTWCSVKSKDEAGLRAFPGITLNLQDRIKCHNFAVAGVL